MYAKFHSGGLAFSCQRIARLLSKHVEKVHVLVFDCCQQYHEGTTVPTNRTIISESDSLDVEIIPPGFSYTGAIIPKRDTLASELQQAYYLIREKVQRLRSSCVISFFILPYGYPCAIVCHEFNIPLVAAVRGNDVGRFIHDPQAIPILNQVFKHARIVQVLASDLGRLVRFLSPTVQNVTIIHNGIDPCGVEPYLKERKYKTEEFVIGTLGIFKPKKGIECLIKAFNKYREPHWRLLLVGDFLKNESLLENILPLESRKVTNMTGIVPRQEALQYLSSIDVFVAPTLSDGCPNATLEAMVARRCIIATRISAAGDLLQHEHSGLLLDYPDIDQLGQFLVRASNNALERQELGNNVRKVVEKLFPPYEEQAWQDMLFNLFSDRR